MIFFILGFIAMAAWAFWIGHKIGVRVAAKMSVEAFIGPLCMGLAELKHMYEDESPPTARAVNDKIDAILADAGIQMKIMSAAEFEKARTQFTRIKK